MAALLADKLLVATVIYVPEIKVKSPLLTRCKVELTCRIPPPQRFVNSFMVFSCNLSQESGRFVRLLTSWRVNQTETSKRRSSICCEATNPDT